MTDIPDQIPATAPDRPTAIPRGKDPMRFARLLFCAIALLTGTSTAKAASTTDIEVDDTGLKEIRILGTESRTIIHADRTARPRLTVTDKGDNRFLCGARARVSRQDDRLIIDIARGTLSLGMKCDITVELTVPPALDLIVEQSASVVELDGAFGRIALSSPTSWIAFEGSLESLSVSGRQSLIAARIAPARKKASLVEIDVDSLIADIGYPFGLPVDYRVDAPAALFSGNIPLSAGAPHRVRISSKAMKGSVFGFQAAQ